MSANRSGLKKKKNTPASDDRAFYKILAAFGTAALAEIFFVAIYRRYYTGSVSDGIGVAMYVVACVCAAACASAACAFSVPVFLQAVNENAASAITRMIQMILFIGYTFFPFG